MYLDEVRVRVNSAIRGIVDEVESLTLLKQDTVPILRAFACDDDVQEMTLCSANFGFVYTYTKQYLPEKSSLEESSPNPG